VTAATESVHLRITVSQPDIKSTP